MVPPYGASHPGYYSHEGVYGGVSMVSSTYVSTEFVAFQELNCIVRIADFGWKM